jgi:hypothetical protein
MMKNKTKTTNPFAAGDEINIKRPASGGINLNRNSTSFVMRLFEFFKNIKWGNEYSFLKYYQNIIRVFVNDLDIDARGLLVYVAMGMGKSILAVAIAMDLIKERQPIILLTKSLQENMRSSIRKYVKMRTQVEPDYAIGRFDSAATLRAGHPVPSERGSAELDHWIDANFSFVSMNASNMLKQIGRAAEGHSAEEFDAALESRLGEVLKMPSLDGKLLIVDEAHNFFRAITNGSKNAHGLYDMIMKSKNLKVIFLTGTPIANDPFEMVPCFNMIGSKHGASILPDSYKEFNKLFVDEKAGKIKNKTRFQNRLMGLVSHVSHSSEPGKALGVKETMRPAEFPEEKDIKVERVNMDPDQYVIYQLARDKEKEEGGMGGKGGRSNEPPSLTKPKSKASSTYRVKSRQLSNYCAPPAARDEKDPAALPESHLESPKYRRIYENIERHKDQLGLVYSQFVGVGGLGTFARYLESKGWGRLEISAADLVNQSDSLSPGTMDKIGGSPSIPSADELLQDLEIELSKAKTQWWAKDITGGETTQASQTDEIDNNADEVGKGVVDEVGDAGEGMDDTSTDIMGYFTAATQPADDGARITFKYATEADAATLLNIDPNYVYRAEDMKYPRYTLIVEEDGKAVGYANVEYTASEGRCVGRLTGGFFEKMAAAIDRALIKKIISDTIRCGTAADAFKKTIWGGSVDVDGALPSRRPDRKRMFAIISGEISIEARAKIQELFNSPENKYGGVIDLVLLSSTGAEGLDLRNGRHIHILEPYWNWGRIMQIIARFVRNDSHISLREGEKNVQPYIYLAIPPDTERLPDGTFAPTTDTELYEEAIKNQLVIESFHEALREISIECAINDEKYCRVCNPTNVPLFTDDPLRDIKAPDPCESVREEQVKAEEILVDGVKYYFSRDDTSIYDYRVYAFDEKINNYRPLKESNPLYAKIIAAIKAEHVGDDGRGASDNKGKGRDTQDNVESDD